MSDTELRRLHFINALFSHLTGHDLYLAQQIKDAIAFSLSELESQMTEHPEYAARYDAAFNEAAARLLSECFVQMPAHGFYHWDAARTLSSATPLFARAELMEGLKHLSPYRESTLLITNLRPALIPADKRATPKRVREYNEALAFIRDLAAARTPRFASLQLLFL
jgi:hypothetical protein